MSYSPSDADDKSTASLLPDAEKRQRLRRWRRIKDNVSRYGITAAGIGVVAALTLIFVYLFSEVLPMFRGATLSLETRYPAVEVAPGNSMRHLSLERYEELGVSFAEDGGIRFFEAETAAIRMRGQVPLPLDGRTTSMGFGEPQTGLVVYGYSNGQVSLLRHKYNLSYPNDVRLISPEVEFPFGEEPVVMDVEGRAITAVAVQEGQRGTAVVAATDDNRLILSSFSRRENMMTGEVTIVQERHELPAPPATVRHVLVDRTLRSVFVADDNGELHYYDIATPRNARLVDSVDVGKGNVSAMTFLLSSVSIIVGTDRGELSQWFLVRDEQNRYSLARVRDFKTHPGAITTIFPEYNRKGFISGDAAGHVGIHYATSARTLLIKKFSDHPIELAAVSPVNSRILTLDRNGDISVGELWNRHPQTSWTALWNKVWYEGRGDPEYIWQSSSGSDEFESKFSLVPLTVGTLKAAFYAMLFAMPLAIMGAIYTAYFMTPKLRGLVKPSIEIMEALPTVILGFLAGLWLAPFIEDHLPTVFSILILMPVGMLAFAFAWHNLPKHLRNRIPEGWEAAMLVPVILIIGWVCVASSPWIELAFFNGSMRQWFTEVGITYDQRNALVVGIAMGFAVIPTIFSIAEDAVFNVPKHLTQGSLALGSTRWQTVMGVVLPTASPGIFSAVMMGFGRAVGETMIVLMATGNSPVVNFNIFEGMRTLSANIAVELPETAVGSSHYRVLFLAALVLFAMTFIVNTIAEVVRQRLRQRYSNL